MESAVEYENIWKEDRGAINIGRMKINDQGIIFKSMKTGKVENFPKSDFRELIWHRLPTCCCVRLMLDNGQLTRFMGFKENDYDKLRNYIQTNFDIELKLKDLCLRGWNWGTAEFKGSVLSFDVEGKSAFEIPLNYVSRCTSTKNEVVLEFHQNDTAAVSLTELRFHLPASGDGVDHRVTAFTDAVLSKANIIQATGDAICTFSELQCLTPRGRYDIKIFPGFIQLHGKTFDYKFETENVLRLFRLPHKDGRQVFFVLSLDPPIKQGQTRYHFLILLFNKEDEVHVELSLSEKELQEKYEGKLEKEISGPTVDILGKIMKAIVGRKITVPGALTASGNPAISCSYRAGAGLLYLLERGFIYVHKPPVHIRFDEISSINFARSGGSTRSFDFEVETKAGQVHTFSSIEKEEYQKIYDFVSSKKLRVKNRGTEPAASATIDDDLIDSDEEEEPDAYLARVKHEGKIREEEGDSDESDESFNPDASGGSDAGSGDEGSDSSGSSGSSDMSTDGDASAEEETPKKKSKPKPKPKEKTKEKKETKRGGKGEKDKNAPKKPLSAYFIWLGENREKIKQKNPGISVTEISKKGGELWREVKDKSEWEKKAAEAKRKYQEAMSDYKASGGGDFSSKKKSDSPKKSKTSKPSKSSQSAKKKTASPTKGSGVFKSREYIDSDDDSSSDDSSGKAAKKGAKKSKKDSDVEMASEATASTPESSGSESD